MNSERLAEILVAAGHVTRLDALRLLGSEPDGLSAGEIARRLGVVQNTLSPHLKKLSAAGLVTVARSGTTISYRLDRTATAALSDQILSI